MPRTRDRKRLCLDARRPAARLKFALRKSLRPILGRVNVAFVPAYFAPRTKAVKKNVDRTGWPDFAQIFRARVCITLQRCDYSRLLAVRAAAQLNRRTSMRRRV